MRKKVFAVLVLTIFTGSTLVSAVPSERERSALLRSSARYSWSAFRKAISDHQRETATSNPAAPSSDSQSNTSTSGTSEQPNANTDETEIASAPEQRDPEHGQTPEVIPVDTVILPVPEPLPPEKDICLNPPPGYILDQPHPSYTAPEICKIDPYPLPPVCPDRWIEDRMPGPIERMPYERQYFIVDGKRVEIDELDLNWILIRCPIEIEYVY